jgi:hypothetical protein
LGDFLGCHRPFRGDLDRSGDGAFSLAFGAVLGAFATVGAVVSARHPHNAVGWLCLAIRFLGSVNGLANPYAAYTFLTGPGSLPDCQLGKTSTSCVVS